MRTASRVEILRRENDEVPYGFVLGGNHCAEHEWGVAALQSRLGISEDPSILGLARRTSQRAPDERLLVLEEGSRKNLRSVPLKKDPSRTRYAEVSNDVLLLAVSDDFRLDRDRGRTVTSLIGDHGGSMSDRDAVGAWDERSFAVIAYSDWAKAFLREVHEAMRRSDLAVWVGARPSGNPFATAGLIVSIASRVPEEGVRIMYEADLDRQRLEAAALETGIVERVKAAGKRYFALSPRWTFKDRVETTSHPVMFWLNPYDQKKNYWGWVTVEELDDWINDRGRILDVASDVPKP